MENYILKAKRVAKKAAVLVGATALAASFVTPAFAATLADLPAPFVENGQMKATIVVGTQGTDPAGLAYDVSGAIDLAAAFAQKATTSQVVSTGEEGTITIGGDSVKMATSTNKLELNENITLPISTITKDDMSVLAKGTFKNDKGSFDYEQTIMPGDAKVIYGLDPNDDTDTPQHYLKFAGDQAAYTYKVTFTPSLKSDVDSNDKLDDLEGKDITLLGKTYSIVTAKRLADNSVELTLMGGAEEATQAHGTTVDYTIKGTTYSVTPSVYSEGVVFEVTYNGKTETTDPLSAGETAKLADGTEIGVKKILTSSKESVPDSVTFYIGAQKVVLKDTDTTSTTTNTLTVGEDTIDGTDVQISGTIGASEATISSITVSYTPDDDIYIPADGKLSEKLEDENQIFLKGFDVYFAGMERGATEEIKVTKYSDTQYKLEFTNKNGNVVSVYAWGYDSGMFLGKEGTTDRYLHVSEWVRANETNATAAIADEEYFVVSGNNKYTHVLQFKDIDTANEVAKFYNVESGETIEVSITNNVNTTTKTDWEGTLTMDGEDYAFKINSTEKYMIIDMNGDGDITTDTPTWYTQKGAEFTINDTAIKITTEEKEDNSKDTVALGLKWDTDHIDYDYLAGVTTYEKDNTDKHYGYTVYGLEVKRDERTSEGDDITFVYPDNEVTYAVYFTSEKTVTKSTTGGVTTTVVNYITPGIGAVDTDINTDTLANPVILVGGPAVNKLVADLVAEGKTQAASDYEQDTAIIQLIENAFGNNAALIVAGYDKEDTRLACRALANTIVGGTGALELTGDKVVLNTGVTGYSQVTIKE